MSKQTAVEWLYEEITKKSVNDPNHNVLLILKQAKEMEKKQITDAYNSERDLLSRIEDGSAAEEYYKETYNS